MTRKVFQPPSAARRQKPPGEPVKSVETPTPNVIEDSLEKGNLRMILMPAIMVVALVGMVFMMLRMNRGAFNPMMLLFPMMMLFAMFGSVGGGAFGGGGKSGAQLLADRKAQSRAIGNARDKTVVYGHQQHKALSYAYPDPNTLAALIGSERMWEVNGGDPEVKNRFTAARYGRGRIKPSSKIRVPEAPDGEFLDPVDYTKIVAFLHAQSTVNNMPLALVLRNYPIITVSGLDQARDRENAVGMVRSMLLELATMHPPTLLNIAVLTDDPDNSDWSFVKWLPHAQHPHLIDGLGSKRMLYPDWNSFGQDLGSNDDDNIAGAVLDYNAKFVSDGEVTHKSKHTVVIVDSKVRAKMTDRAIKALAQVTWILIDPPAGVYDEVTDPGVVMLTVDDEKVVRRFDTDLPLEPAKEIALADHLDMIDANMFARRLARFEPETTEALLAREERSGQDWASLVGVEDPGAIDVVDFWQRIKRFDDPRRLNFPIGFGPDGSRIFLNIREASQGGTGPHGEMIGTSGSGKSEFLRCLVLDACLFHSPTMLNLLLVDFKGGATYQGMEEIPHVAAVVTNLEKSETMVDRMMEVITGELKRRQQIFDSAAARYPSFNIIGLTEYEKARESGHCPDLEPMPALVVLIDEYTELLEAKPEFVNIFSQIGRVGRSVGVHLLLASQNAEMARSRGLESNIHYHIALRTGTAGDSRAVIGVPDAKNLPGKPGHGLIKTLHEDDLIRFYAGFTGKPYFPPVDLPAPDSASTSREFAADTTAVRDFTAAVVELPEADVEEPEEKEVVRTEEELLAAPTTFTVVKELLKKAPSRPAYKPWLPELDSTTLDTIAPHLSRDKWVAPLDTTPARLVVPFGLFDDPAKHQQPVWNLDLSGGGGNVLIFFAPHKGKTTAAMTLVTSLALTHTPNQAQFFIVDGTGGPIGLLEDLPHVATVVTRAQEDEIHRIISQMRQLLDERRRLFRKHRINSMDEYRAARSVPGAAILDEDAYGDVFVVIDGLDAVMSEGGPLEMRHGELESLAVGGLNYGLHFIVTTSRNTVMRSFGSQFQTIIEGHVGGASYDMSMVSSQRNKTVPDRAGTAITMENELLGLVSLPRADGDVSRDSLVAGARDLISRVREAFGDGNSERRLLALPTDLREETLLARVAPAASDRDRVRIPFGLHETNAAPALADLGRGGHLMIIGESGSGRSAAIHSLIEGITHRFPDKGEAALAVLDPKRSHVGAHAINNLQVEVYASTVADFVGDGEGEGGGLNGRFGDWFADVAPDSNNFRKVPAGADAQRLYSRDWWNGPEIFLVIDDYDLLGPRSTDNGLYGMTPLIKDGAWRGVHLILAISDDEYLFRSQNDPLLKALSDAPTFVLSASRHAVDIGGHKGEQFGIPGRARFHPGRNAPSDLVQVAWNGIRRDGYGDQDAWG